MIRPFQFGSGAQRLFGAYHESMAGTVRGGVVLCHAAAHEYIWSHRAIRTLAEQLAAAGFHVLRFDYFATGDSAGETDEGNVATWTTNIGTAVDELKEMTGLSVVSLVGLRMGATLATRAAHMRHDIDRIVLWDPIIRGATYLDEVASLHDVVTAANATRRTNEIFAPRELLGFPMPARLEDELADLRLNPAEVRAQRGVLVVVSEDLAEYASLHSAPRNILCEWTFRLVSGSGRWDQMGRFGTALLPRDIIATTVSWLEAA